MVRLKGLLRHMVCYLGCDKARRRQIRDAAHGRSAELANAVGVGTGPVRGERWGRWVWRAMNIRRVGKIVRHSGRCEVVVVVVVVSRLGVASGR